MYNQRLQWQWIQIEHSMSTTHFENDTTQKEAIQPATVMVNLDLE